MTLPRLLTGGRVLDFTWVRAGPWATRWLGAFGAEIIKIDGGATGVGIPLDTMDINY
jgi:crotonobetainyl-CoA:carnitine CoA-transferase CaiB-like acyl-CoA transferase